MNRVLVIDDDQGVLNSLFVCLTQTRRFKIELLQDSTQAFQVIDAGDFDLILLDMDMPEVSGRDVLRFVHECHPEVEVVVITGVEDVHLAVEAIKLGAYDYLCKPIGTDQLLGALDRALERSSLRGEVARLREQVLAGGGLGDAFAGLVTQDKGFLRVLCIARQIAQSSNNVLIWGETGTGKELVACAIHRLSPRRERPFVAVNAAEFSSELLASELFGHERGAFTGAVSSKQGFIEAADGGTLFIDEIGELDLPVQAKLLRVLQSGEYFRLGSTQKRGADVRIVAATNKDLSAEMEAGRFRRDLYYRLNISSIFLPPLRERRGDVKLCAYWFLDKYSRQNGKTIQTIADDVLDLLECYDYPGNVRELENLVASAVVLERGDALTRESLPGELVRALTAAAPVHVLGAHRTLAQVEAEHIRSVVEQAGGNRTLAAQILGISRVGLLGKMKRYGIDVTPARAEGRVRKAH